MTPTPEDIAKAIPVIARDGHFAIPEHETLFTFNSDMDCERFHDWWSAVGKDSLKEYLRDRLAKEATGKW